MMKKPESFIAYEHLLYNLRGNGSGRKKLPLDLFENLKKFYGDNGTPYYSLTHTGVKFNEYVGVLQIGKWVVEVLPKVDKHDNEKRCQRVLIQMLKAAGYINVHSPSSSSLRLRSNYILESYINMFLDECEFLVHCGLVKTYRKTEGSRLALKGRLMFAQHLQKNLVHQERFYVEHTTYDRQHELNRVLRKTLLLVSELTTNGQSIGRVNRLLLDFPEMPNISVSDGFFERIDWTRKTEPYRKGIEISMLLLLNYHPDLSMGKSNVLALMFDMNMLWEKYVLKQLKKAAESDTVVKGQSAKRFWEAADGGGRFLKPDIVIEFPKKTVILDTKWKLVEGSDASVADLRQMLAYNLYFGEPFRGSENIQASKESYLLYPRLGGISQEVQKGSFEQKLGHTHLMWLTFINEGRLNNELGKALLKRLRSSL